MAYLELFRYKMRNVYVQLHSFYEESCALDRALNTQTCFTHIRNCCNDNDQNIEEGHCTLQQGR